MSSAARFFERFCPLILVIVAGCGRGPAKSAGLDTDVQSVEETGQTDAPDLDLARVEDFSEEFFLAIESSDIDNGQQVESLGPLSLTGVAPGKGDAAGGQTVVLTGSGFQPDMVVVFDQSKSPAVTVADQYHASVVTPPHPPGYVTIRVTRKDGETARLENAFLYAKKTMVAGVEPSAVPAQGGAPVDISGAGFLDGATVLVGGRACPKIQVVHDGLLRVVTPAGEPGTHDVIVTSQNGQGILKDAILYYADTEVEAVFPASGPPAGAFTITVEGSGFYPPVEVYFGGIPGEVLDGNEFRLSVEVPPGKGPGPVDLLVQSAYGQVEVADGFYYVDEDVANSPLKVWGVVPSFGPASGGNLATVVASGVGTGWPTVKFGEKAADVQDVSAPNGSIQVLVPSGVPGSVDVSVMAGGHQATAKDAYEYREVLKVTKVAPGQGPASGGTEVTISGGPFHEGASVFFGGLPASKVKLVSQWALNAVTPVGSPGMVPVTVVQETGEATLKDGFRYVAPPQVFAIAPAEGAISGGMLVHIYGTGLDHVSDILFGTGHASHVVEISPEGVECRTPPGEPGAVDVTVVNDGKQLTLKQAFEYYDPTALYGGTWGPPLQGTLNVTVLDASSGGPLQDAFVMVGTDPTTAYQGYTGPDGVITFSGSDLTGPQSVTASKDCYNSSTVTAFDATNVTIYLQYTCPVPGGMPPGVTPATVKGRVIGLGKYVVPPPGNCWLLGVGSDGVSCKPCSDDSDCPSEGASCVKIADYGSFCTTPCLTSSDCLEGYVCLATAAGKPQCLPSPGKKTAMCYATQPDPFTENPPPGPGSEVDSSMRYSISVRPGKMAIVCLGGVKDPVLDQFKPLVMGVKRQVSVMPGQEIDGVDVKLDIPLDRRFRVYLVDPPLLDFNYLLVFYDFGEDGVFQETWSAPFSFGTPEIVVENQPRRFLGELSDASFLFIGGAFSATPDNTPFSVALATDVVDLKDDTMFRLDGDVWSVQKTGITRSMFGMWGTSGDDFFVVGEEESIYHYDGHYLTLQHLVPKGVTLRAVGGRAPDDVWGVGDNGRMLHFDGVGWSDVKVAQIQGFKLEGVSCHPSGACFVVGPGTAMYSQDEAWMPVPGTATLNLRAVQATDAQESVAVGTAGLVARLSPEGGTTLGLSPAADFNAVTVDQQDRVWICGAKGTVVVLDGDNSTQVETNTSEDLFAVVVGHGHVYAFGNRGTIVAIDPDTMEASLVHVPDYVPHLRCAFAAPAEGGSVFAMGISQFPLGPFVAAPKLLHPKDSGQLTAPYVEFSAEGGVPASFHYLLIAIPGLFGDTPVWEMVTSGDVFRIDLPDIENIEGLQGIPKGTPLKLTLLRILKPGLDIDHFDYTDLSPLTQKGWSADIAMFQRP